MEKEGVQKTVYVKIQKEKEQTILDLPTMKLWRKTKDLEINDILNRRERIERDKRRRTGVRTKDIPTYFHYIKSRIVLDKRVQE